MKVGCGSVSHVALVKGECQQVAAEIDDVTEEDDGENLIYATQQIILLLL